MRHIWLAVLLCMSMAMGHASAQVGKTEHVKARLVADSTTLPVNGTITLALDYVAEDGWHTYFVNPGEAGLAAEFKWLLPKEAYVGDIQWPTPKTLNLLGLISYGYDGRTILLIPLHGTGDLSVGQTLNLSAKVNFLVCKDICVPESEDVAISLKVGPKSENPVPEVFTEAQSKMPTRDQMTGTIEINDGMASIGLIPSKPLKSLKNVYFYPYGEDILSAPAVQSLERGSDGFSLKTIASATTVTAEGVKGIVSVNGKGYEVVLKPAPLASTLYGQGIKPEVDLMTILLAISFAFVGGMILNLMPCVFPVLSMKMMAISQAGQDQALARSESRFYSLGAVLSFIALALFIEMARRLGGTLGWGFQLQNPYVTAGLALVMLLVGLNMAGLFHVGTSLQGVGASLSFGQSRPRIAAFFTGILAVVVAAPCTAPFMATAVGIALSQGGLTNLVIFLSLGLGFVAPVLLLTHLISYSPTLAAKMPRPGVWMDRLKIALSVPMFLAALWLWWVFSKQIAGYGPIILALGLVGIAAMFLPVIKMRWLKLAGLGVGMAVCVYAASLEPAPKAPVATGAPYVAFDAKALEQYRAEGRPVIVDMTAAWCVTCKVNERLVLSSNEFVVAVRETNTVYMVGDWTNADPEITAYLDGFGRSGVPLYVYYPPNRGAPIILPQLLDKESLLKTLSEG